MTQEHEKRHQLAPQFTLAKEPDLAKIKQEERTALNRFISDGVAYACKNSFSLGANT